MSLIEATVAIPWRPTPDRLPAYHRCLNYWHTHNLPTITADSDPDKPFHRAQARNNAVQQATTPIVILADADTLPANHQLITTAIRLAKRDNTAIWPYTRYRLLPADATTTDDLSTVTPIREWPIRHRPGGLTITTTTAYNTVGGYDEKFTAGWGYEDGAFHHACTTLLPNVQHLSGIAYAFDHSGDRTRSPRNKRRYWWYMQATGDPARMRRLITPKPQPLQRRHHVT